MSELNTAEKYNPQLNQWQTIMSMKSRRSGVFLPFYFNQSPSSFVYCINLLPFAFERLDWQWSRVKYMPSVASTAAPT